jgi:hypothetical protein
MLDANQLPQDLNTVKAATAIALIGLGIYLQKVNNKWAKRVVKKTSNICKVIAKTSIKPTWGWRPK